MEKNITSEDERFTRMMSKFTLRFASPRLNSQFTALKVASELRSFIVVQLCMIIGLTFEFFFEKKFFIMFLFLSVQIFLTLAAALFRRYLTLCIFLAQLLIICIGHQAIYEVLSQSYKNQVDFSSPHLAAAPFISELMLCSIMKSTGMFSMDLVISASFCLAQVLYNLDSNHFPTFGAVNISVLVMKYFSERQSRYIFLKDSENKELLNFLRQTSKADLLLTRLDHITHDLEIKDHSLSGRGVVRDISLRQFVEQIKLERPVPSTSQQPSGTLDKQQTLKDYLMITHWNINNYLDRKLYLSKQLSLLDKMEQQPLSTFDLSQRQSNLPQIEVSSMLQKRLAEQLHALAQRKGQLLIKLNDKQSGDSIFPIKQQLDQERVDVFYGIYEDMTVHKKKIKWLRICVKQLCKDSAFLCISIQDETEKREFADKKNNFSKSLTEYQTTLNFIKNQAIDTLRQVRKFQTTSASVLFHPRNPSILLLGLVNQVDCCSDTLSGAHLSYIEKSNFSLRNLLLELEDVYNAKVSFVTLDNSAIPAPIILGRNSSQPGRTQRDSLFSKLKNTVQLMQTECSLEIPTTLSFANRKTSAPLSSNIFQSDDQISLYNDKYRVRQVLIALTSNMIAWSIPSESGDALSFPSILQNQHSQVQITCQEEKSSLFTCYEINLLQKLSTDLPAAKLPRTSEQILKFLNGWKPSTQNRGCLDSIKAAISLIGPYKLRAKFCEENRTIEVSFFVFKDIDVLREKKISMNEESPVNTSVAASATFQTTSPRAQKRRRQTSKMTTTIKASQTNIAFQGSQNHQQQLRKVLRVGSVCSASSSFRQNYPNRDDVPDSSSEFANPSNSQFYKRYGQLADCGNLSFDRISDFTIVQANINQTVYPLPSERPPIQDDGSNWTTHNQSAVARSTSLSLTLSNCHQVREKDFEHQSARLDALQALHIQRDFPVRTIDTINQKFKDQLE